MHRVTVVTDSSATVPGDLVHKLDIRVVSHLLTPGGQTFQDGVDVTPEHVHRGGRIGGAGALMGTLLQIKPVLS